MKQLVLVIVSLLAVQRVLAGDDAHGTHSCSVDLSQPFTVYEMSEQDRHWSRSLVVNLHYAGKPLHFVKTSLPLIMDGTPVQSTIYQCIEKPKYFYVLKGDAMLELGVRWAYSPGCGGFSMHAPKSQNFIVCLECQTPCVPFHSSSPVIKGRITWMCDDSSRL